MTAFAWSPTAMRDGVRLVSRKGTNLTRRFPAMAIASLSAGSCVIDGEAIDLIRGHKALATAVNCAFDLLELDGDDLRRRPIEQRKSRLAKLLHGAHPTSYSSALPGRWHRHFLAGLQAWRRGHRLETARLTVQERPFPHWLKIKNPMARAATRKVEEDWS